MIKWHEPDVRKMYPLTHPQKRIWYTEQISPGTGLFNIGGMLRIKGEIQPTVMERAAHLMVERNDALRLCIINDNGEPKQYLREIAEFEMEYMDLSQNDKPLTQSLQWITEKTKELMPEGELVQCALVKIANDDYIYMQKCHHMVCDGWTFALIKQELEACYRHLLHGTELPEPPASYLDFIQDEEDYKESNRFVKHREFWIENFQNIPQAVTLSPNIARSKVLDAKRYTVRLDQHLTQNINQFVRETSSSVYSFFMALLYTYMYRITGSEDIIIGTPVLNRSNARQKNTVGMFVSTMPFRVKVDDHSTFVEFLKVIMSEQRGYYRNQKYPMDLLVKDLELAKKGNHKLFEISLSYQNSTYEQTFDGNSIELEWIFNGHEENALIIHINDRNDTGELIVDFDYALDAFTEEQIQQVASHMLNLAKKVIVEPNVPLWKIPYLSEKELELVLDRVNQTEVSYPGHETTISQIIEEQVEQTPEEYAVVFGEQKLTYRRLNSFANELAQLLVARGVGPDKLVGLLVERSVETIVGILGVLKAGGAYVPIDPEYPDERCIYMLEDANCQILLTQSTLQERVPGGFTGEVLYLDQLMADSEGVFENLMPQAGPNHLSYVIYTSGSTGKPKGVMIENRGLTNYIWWAKDYYCPDCPANFPLYSSLSFDLTVTSIFVPLAKGSTINIMGHERGNLISEVIKQENVNIVKLTPAHLSLIKDEDNSKSSVRKFILGGEDLKADLARAAIQSFGGSLEIYNEYGPTETVVGCIIHKFDPTETYSSVLIGLPIANTQIYILDKYLQPVPPGAVGEIYISGDGVARGYLNRPELTAEKFLPNPFVPGKRMYRSGDLGRYLSDGRMEYLGRVDNQVKIRGYRIEIGEIEAALLQHPEIKDGVVDVRMDSAGSKYLVGYVVSDKELTIGELRGHLLNTLPEYMVPTAFVKLEEIPLTSNGKVNRKALPEPTGNIATGVEYSAPESQMEEIIAQVWAEVLGFEQVGVNDNFFELGGDSIKAIQVSTRLKNKGIECKVQDIFTYHTVAQVALHVTTNVKKVRAEQGVLQGEVNSTPITEWFFELNLNQPDYYNQSILLDLAPQVDIEALTRAFEVIIRHHDALRLNYQPDDGKLYYENKYLEQKFVISEIDLCELEITQQELTLQKRAEEIKGSLNICNSLLLKAALFKLSKGQRKLLITIHHLVIDGVSWRILLEDLATVYLQMSSGSEIQLPAKSTSYKEWAEVLAEYAHSDKLVDEAAHWDSVLAQSEPLVAKYGLIAENQLCKVMLAEDETTKILTTANEAYNTKTNDLLLTALVITLTDWLKQDQICVWLEGHGREELFDDIDLSRTIGWFTSVYPVNLKCTGYTDLTSYIKGIKEQLRKIPEKGIGYGILKYLTKHPFKPETNLRGIVFNYLGQFDQDLPTDLFNYSSSHTGSEVGQSNQRTNLLELNSMVIEGKLQLEANFSGQIYQPQEIMEMLATYVDNLREVIAHCCTGDNFGFTPSDFDTVELSQEDLDALFG